ncbi:hypothetical protein [Streptomyces sp. NPDC057545]|uniref:hypothetical protein n=1 Tax=unclassified Streptomyces TaxID=2593676 RepID=UPI00369D05A1
MGANGGAGRTLFLNTALENAHDRRLFSTDGTDERLNGAAVRPVVIPETIVVDRRVAFPRIGPDLARAEAGDSLRRQAGRMGGRAARVPCDRPLRCLDPGRPADDRRDDSSLGPEFCEQLAELWLRAVPQSLVDRRAASDAVRRKGGGTPAGPSMPRTR